MSTDYFFREAKSKIDFGPIIVHLVNTHFPLSIIPLGITEAVLKIML